MPCPDCFTSCNGEIVSDRCVKYTGEDIPALGINHGDQLSMVEKQVIEALLAAMNGSGIYLSAPTCPALIAWLAGRDPNLANLIDVLFQESCSLRQALTALTTTVTNYQNVTFDATCLGLSATASRDAVVAALLIQFCQLKARVAAIEADYVKASQLSTLVLNILQGQQGQTTQHYLKMIPYVALPYFGPLANFDATGKGVPATGFDKVYLCNGQNGTPDIRGRAIVGTIASVPGGQLDPDVDPALPENAGRNWQLKQKFGKNTVKLSLNEIPTHSHGVTDPGHAHNTAFQHYRDEFKHDGYENETFRDQASGSGFGGFVLPTTTGITIKTAGGGQPHENAQPSIAAHFIMYLP